MFYKITSSTLMFHVRAVGNAYLGLSQQLDSCMYWIGLGDNDTCWIKKVGNASKSVSTPNIITLLEYKSFWITWSGGYIKLGRNGEEKPIIMYTNNTPNLSYVTFSVLRESNPVYWKFELPPILKRPQIKHITSGEPHWVPFDGKLPDGAIIGGYEGETLYIIRAVHMGSWTPGKFTLSRGAGYVSWGGESHEKQQFEVLCGFDCIWVPSSKDRIPVGALEAGEYNNHMELYVGRVKHHDHIIPGKVQPIQNLCHVPYKDSEISMKKYEILIQPTKNMHSVNKYYLWDVGVEYDDVENEWQ